MKPRVRSWAALLALPILLLLPGCMRMQVDVNIADVDNVSIVMNIGVDKQLAAQSGQEVTGEQICTQNTTKPANATVEPYDDGKFVGCKMSVKGKVSETNNMVSFDEAKKVWTFSMPGSELSSGGQVSASMITDFKVSVTFPGKVLTKSGSGTISGNTVTWRSPADLFTAEGLKATAEAGGIGSGMPWWLWLVIGVAALAVIGALVYFLVLKKKPAAPAAPQYPGTAQPTFAPQAPAAPQGYGQAPAPGYQPPAQPFQPPAQPFQPPAQPPAQNVQGFPPAPVTGWEPPAPAAPAYEPPAAPVQPAAPAYQPPQYQAPNQAVQPPADNSGYPQPTSSDAQPPLQGYQPPSYQPPTQGN